MPCIVVGQLGMVHASVLRHMCLHIDPHHSTRGPDGMWAAHVPAARFLQLEGNVRDVPDSLQSLPSCMEAADVLSASPICLAATADRGVPHMCRSTEACAMRSCPTTMHDMFQ